jgi:hypothetical protein
MNEGGCLARAQVGDEDPTKYRALIGSLRPISLERTFCWIGIGQAAEQGDEPPYNIGPRRYRLAPFDNDTNRNSGGPRRDTSDVAPKSAWGICLIASKIDLGIRAPKTLALHEQEAILSRNAELQTFRDAFYTLDEMCCRRGWAHFDRRFAKQPKPVIEVATVDRKR